MSIARVLPGLLLLICCGLLGGIAQAQTAAPVAPPPAAAPPPPPRPVAFDAALLKAANDLFSKAKLEGAPDKVTLIIDPLIDGVTGAQSIIDQLVPCSGPASGGTWKNHGQYVSSVAHAAQTLANQGCINEQEKGQIVSEAARSNCGKGSNGHHGNHTNHNKNHKNHKNHKHNQGEMGSDEMGG